MYRRIRFRLTIRRAANIIRSRLGKFFIIAVSILLAVWIIFRLFFVVSSSNPDNALDKQKLLSIYTREKLAELRQSGQIPLCRAPHYPVFNTSLSPESLPACPTQSSEDTKTLIHYTPLLQLAASRLVVNTSHPFAKNLTYCRVRGIEWENDDQSVQTKEEIFTADKLGIYLSHDFVLTDCQVRVGNKLENVHQVLVQTSPKPHVYQRIVEQLQRAGKHPRPDVLIVIIGDADVTRRRQLLPKTIAYLETRRALEVPGLNGLSYEMKDNIIPLLTGRHLHELPNARRGTTSSQYVDIFNFLWYEYEKHAYATLLAEDTSLDTVFNKELHGFEQRPTDHYMRPFWMEMQRESCLYGRHRQEYLFDFVRDFFFNYHNITKFAVMVHHPGVEGNPESISALDESLANLLTSLSILEGEESNLAFFLLGVPHFPTKGFLNSFEQSEMARRLATAQIMLPDWFKVKYTSMWENFIRSTGQLTTFFDLNMFLRDLLQVGSSAPSLGPNQDVHAHSLLRNMIRDKNCINAGIPLPWCTCVRRDQIDTKDDVANKAVLHLIFHLNRVTEAEKAYCRTVEKYQILYADIFTPKTKETVRVRGGPKYIREDKRIKIHYFHLVFEVDNTNSIFTGVVGLDSQTGTFNAFTESVVRLRGAEEKLVKNERIRQLCVPRD